MKSKILLTAVTLCSAVFFASCTDEDVVGVEHSCYQKISAEIVKPDEAQDSRSCVDVKNPSTSFIGLLWQPADKIGVFSNKKENSGNFEFTSSATENVPQAEFGGTMTGTPCYAYYPYSSENDQSTYDNLKGTLLSEQPFNPESGTLVCDYKYGKLSSEGTNLFTFKQLFTMLRITIDATETDLEGERLNSIVLKVTDADGNVRPICGSFTFDATNGSWNAESSTTSNTITMPWTTRPNLSANRSYQGFITVMPVVKKGDKLAVEVLTEGHKVSFVATSQISFEAGFVYNIPLKLKAFADALNNKFQYNEEEITRPGITSFEFKVANNTGKLLDNELKWNSSNHTPSFSGVSSYSAKIENDEITLTIPYLYDFKLKPTFVKSSANSKVLVNGVEQTSGETEVDFTKPVTYTVVGAEGGTRDYTVKVTNTGLPVVVINQSTEGDFKEESKTVMTGFLQFKKITLNKFVDFMIRNKDTDWVKKDQITIYKADGTLDCTVTGGVRLRGNTTRDYPKKPFAIKFNDKKSVLGMPEHKRWVLLANWLDHSMIRNSVAFDIAQVMEYAWRQSGGVIGDGIPWNVHGQHVELVFIENGKAHHVGNYYLCEQIKIDENRLNIKDSYEDVLSNNIADCGYLLEFDSKEDTDPYFTTSNGIKVKYKDDAIEGTNLATAVKNKIQSIEDNLDNGKYSAAYEDLDINTMIDQWLIWELTMNREYGDPGSVYMYMDGDGKLCAGPVWDFDRGTFQNQENAKSYGNSDRIKPDNEWMCWRSKETYIWYKQLIKDKTFQQTVQQRWAVIKPYLDMIEDQIRYYGQTQAVSYFYDSAMWPTLKDDVQEWKNDFSDWSGDEQLGTNGNYQEVIDNFVKVYNERLAGMDALITSGKFTK